MPYKDPERKRQWERDHREERNARRRKQPFPAETIPNMHDPIPDQEAQSWQLVVGLTVGIGIVLVAVLIFRPMWARKRTQKKLENHSPAAIS